MSHLSADAVEIISRSVTLFVAFEHIHLVNPKRYATEHEYQTARYEHLEEFSEELFAELKPLNCGWGPDGFQIELELPRGQSVQETVDCVRGFVRGWNHEADVTEARMRNYVEDWEDVEV